MTTSTADLWDEQPDVLFSPTTQFRDFGGTIRFSGPARTVRCAEDNVLLDAVLKTPGDGAVLIIDGGASLACALIGDRIAGQAIANGWSGLIINGAVRDSASLATLPIGIKALGTNPRKSGKRGNGEKDVDLEIGGAVIRPGMMVYADEDGVLVEG
ncbi:ribonuclease E activity regulator RraA [Microbacterium sp. NPDC058345]|uniref:ribonuclease E activity regulator RraA n=1 Tax=Microbacterium sp. NPDC058345 TaxID=3346455 RepID=UPI0036513211